MFGQLLLIFGLLALSIFAHRDDFRTNEKIKDLKTTVVIRDEFNHEPNKENKPLRVFDYQVSAQGEPHIFEKVSVVDLNEKIGLYNRNEPHSLILVLPDGEAQVKHILFEYVQLWKFPLAWLFFETKPFRCVRIETTYLKDFSDLKEATEEQLINSTKIRWINALYFFTGKSYFSNDLCKYGKSRQMTHNELLLDDAKKIYDLKIIFSLIKNVLLKTLSFDKKGKLLRVAPSTNALPFELIEHLKKEFPNKKAIKRLTKTKALELYSWICDNAAKEFSTT